MTGRWIYFHGKASELVVKCYTFIVDPWSRPGLRERAVLDQDITKSDQFWREVIQLFEFNWPYSVEDAFWLDQSSGLYNFTGLYERQVREIRMWNMNPSFFTSFPDTFEDIVPAANISMSPSLPLPAADFYRLLPAGAKGGETDKEEGNTSLGRGGYRKGMHGSKTLSYVCTS